MIRFLLELFKSRKVPLTIILVVSGVGSSILHYRYGIDVSFLF